MSVPVTTFSRMNDVQAQLVAEVERELAELRTADEQVAAGLARRTERRQDAASIVYSIRLDRAEVAALERRAAVIGIKPTVLARNLVRTGLNRRRDAEVAAAIDGLEAAVKELRQVVG